jgi:hypothetical protein
MQDGPITTRFLPTELIAHVTPIMLIFGPLELHRVPRSVALTIFELLPTHKEHTRQNEAKWVNFFN